MDTVTKALRAFDDEIAVFDPQRSPAERRRAAMAKALAAVCGRWSDQPETTTCKDK